MSWIEWYQLAVLALLVGLFLASLANLMLFPRLRPGRVADHGMVSLLVPARNEEANIEACVRSLAAQDYPQLEVIVLDDRSEDDTAAVLERCGFVETAENPKARLKWIRGVDLPQGWAGKPWACHQLAGQAQGQWLLFTDADTIHDPGAVSAAVELAVKERASLLSAWPWQKTGSWSERLVVPLLYILTHVFLPQAMVRGFLRFPEVAARLGPRRMASFGAANGQFMLFTRDAYERAGGHEAVRDHLVEDVAIGRRIMADTGKGARLVNADSSGLVRCRMYRSFAEVWSGFSKNVRPVFERNGFSFVAFGVFQAAVFVLPFLFVILPLAGREWVVAQIAVILLIRTVLALRFRTSWWSVVLHPFAYALAMLIALNSWRLSRAGKIQWKGRIYDPFRSDT